MESPDFPVVSAAAENSPLPSASLAPDLSWITENEALRSFLGGALIAGKRLLDAHGCGIFLRGSQGENLPLILGCCHAKETLADMGEWKDDGCRVVHIRGSKGCRLIAAPIFCWSRGVGGLFYSFSPGSAELSKLFPAVESLARQVGDLLETEHPETGRDQESAQPEKVRESLRKAGEAGVKSGALATLGKMVSVTIHEIFNPLSIINLSIEKLLLTAKLSEDAVKTLGLIGQQVERIEKIASRLRSIPNGPVSEIGPVDIENLLKEVSGLVEPELKRCGVRVGLIRRAESAPVMADKYQLVQLFLNLIYNARDAMPDGGMLAISLDTCWRNGREWVELRFSDTGCGIPQQNLPRVFEDFFSTKPEGKGMGLGLSICEEIVTSHGGRIGVVSEQGRGTTFTVELPSLGGGSPSRADGNGNSERRVRA